MYWQWRFQRRVLRNKEGGTKRSKGPWPLVPVGKCFIVAKEGAEKWPPKQHTSMVANAKFMVTWRFSSLFESLGLGIENPEAPRGRLDGAESVMMM